jgi:hypothetical protein
VISSSHGSLFNPNDAAFAGSGGNLAFSSGTLTFNTNTGAITGAPAGMSAGQNFYAVRSQSGSVELALFVFDSISLSQAVTINVVGDRGLVLASRGNFQFGSSLRLDGGNAPTVTAFGTAGAGGSGAPGSDSGTAGSTPASAPPGTTRGNGGQAGYGVNGSSPNIAKHGIGAGGGRANTPSSGRAFGGSGGGYGGNGGVISGVVLSGKTYGAATLADLFGGSGGAGAEQTTATNTAPASSSMGGGGGGGGAVELISLGTLTLSGSISARGGNGGGSSLTTGSNSAGGGGSGGGVIVAANNIVLSGSVNAGGGDSGALAGGTKAEGAGGGGGRVAFYYNTLAGSLATQVSVAGGKGGLSTLNGADGTVYDATAGSFPFQPVAGPELSSLTLACFAAAPLLLLGRGRRNALEPK